LVPLIGILGAAISTLIAYGLAFLIVLHYSSKEFELDFDPKFISNINAIKNP
jgi:Na+-driven multidrug efflux pump